MKMNFMICIVFVLLKFSFALEHSGSKCEGCPDPFKVPVVVKKGQAAPPGIIVLGANKVTITRDGGGEFCLDQYVFSDCTVKGTTAAGAVLNGVNAIRGKKIVKLEIDCDKGWEVLLCLPKIELCERCPGTCQEPHVITIEGTEIISPPYMMVIPVGEGYQISRVDGKQFCIANMVDEGCTLQGNPQDLIGKKVNSITVNLGTCPYWVLTVCLCEEVRTYPTTTQPTTAPPNTCVAPPATSEPCRECPADCQTKVFLSNLFIGLFYHGYFLPRGMCLKPYAQAVYDETKKGHRLTIILKTDFCIHDFYIEIDNTSARKVTGVAWTTEGKKKVKFCQTHSGKYRIRGRSLVGKKMKKFQITCKPLRCKILSWMMCICVK